MYRAIVILLMLVLPLACIAVEALLLPGASLVALVGKWFVFWAVGMRLFTAGVRQMAQPAFTAQTIFAVKDPAAFTVVTELGVSNVAIGVVALASLWLPGWTMPAAVYGLIFYGIASARHLGNRSRSAAEQVATWSDLWAALVLAGWIAALLAGWR